MGKLPVFGPTNPGLNFCDNMPTIYSATTSNLPFVPSFVWTLESWKDHRGSPYILLQPLCTLTTLFINPCILQTCGRWQPSEIVQQLKVFLKLFRRILTHYVLYKYIVWSHIFISLLTSVFSSTLLIACTISVFPVR